MGSESFRILGIDPFKTCSPSEADAVVEEARKKAEIRKTKGQSLLEKQNAQRDLDALPGCRRDVLDPAVAAKAREEVLSIITRDLDRYLFHRIDGSAVFFEKNIDDILEPALKKNWNVDRDAVSFIKGAKMVSEKDFKDLPSDTAFSILNSLGTDDIVAWTNSAIDALYSGDSGSVPQKVSPDTSYPTFKSAINAVAARAQKVQTNSHFKDAAKKYYPLLKKLIPMFANESSYKKFRTAAIMYSVESELQSGTSSLDYRTIASLINSRIAGKGVNTDEALRELERFCLSKGILADFSKVSREYAACGFCGCRFRIDKDTNFCPYCNKPMAVKCPRCGVRNNSSNIHCKGCGLDFSFLSDIPSLEKGLREDIRKGNMGSIKAVLPRFEGYEDFADKSLLKEAEDFVKETGDLMRDLRSMESSGKYCS
ncbi:MAG: hypothetical protein J5494_00475, partial [Candidatus Methanomethylophilaceae archaeon]|nr:hypothetical protein [Candidatus Methanomethylophilaceae archaeon]